MNIAISGFSIDCYDDALALWKQCEGVDVGDADSRENIQAYLARNPDMSFVAKENDKLVGSILAGHDARRGYIYHLAVHPSCRRRGIGRRLIQNALTALRNAGIQKALLFIFNDNDDGIDFWQSMGWKSHTTFGVMSKRLDGSP